MAVAETLQVAQDDGRPYQFARHAKSKIEKLESEEVEKDSRKVEGFTVTDKQHTPVSGFDDKYIIGHLMGSLDRVGGSEFHGCPRWYVVSELCGLDKESSVTLCGRFGINPNRTLPTKQ